MAVDGVRVDDPDVARRQLCLAVGLSAGGRWHEVVHAVTRLADADVPTLAWPAKDVRHLADILDLLDTTANERPFTFTGDLVMVDEDGDPVPLPVVFDVGAECHMVRLRPGVRP
jgi:hypothetical protein